MIRILFSVPSARLPSKGEERRLGGRLASRGLIAQRQIDPEGRRLDTFPLMLLKIVTEAGMVCSFASGRRSF